MKTKSATFVILSSIIVLLGLLLAAPPVQAQGGIPVWTNRYNGPTNTYSAATAMAVDGAGNVFVTGSLGDGNGSDYDYVTIKYSNAGAPLWTNRYAGSGNGWDNPCCIAVDSSGDVIVTGTSDHSGSESSHTNFDYATIKYSNAGVPLWTNRYNGPGNASDQPTSMAVDASGNVFVTGISAGDGTGADYATIKYSKVGVALWTNRYNGLGNASDFASSVAVDSNGNVFVTGASDIAGGSNADYDYATIKYSNAGAPLWIARYQGLAQGQDVARSIAVDGSGNVIVTGSSDRSDLEGSIYSDYCTIKYSNAGATLWEKRFAYPPDGNAYASAMAVDSNGKVFVTGEVSQIGSSTSDFATVAYSSSGVLLWSDLDAAGNYYNRPRAIAVDGRGNVIVTGSSTITDTNYNTHIATIAYSTVGVPLWSRLYLGPMNTWAQANAVAADGNGNVFVTGSSGTSGTSDFVTIKYSSVSPPPVRLTIQRTPTNTVVISWPSPSTGFQLQQNTNRLGSVNWSNVTGAIQDNGTNRFIIVNPHAGSRFYRLFKP